MGTIVQYIRKHFQADELTVGIFAKEYYSVLLMLGYYPIFESNYLYLSMIVMFVNMFMVPCHMVLMLYTALSVKDVDMSLFVSELNGVIIFLYGVSSMSIANWKRRSVESIHREVFHIGRDFDDEFSSHKNDGEMKRLVVVVVGLISLALGSSGFIIVCSGYVDTRFGTIKPELLEMHITFHLPLPIRYPINVLDSNTFYYIALVLQYIALLGISHTIIGATQVFIVFVYVIVRQINIFLKSIETIKQRANRLCLDALKNDKFLLGSATDEDILDFYLLSCLKRIFQHHQLIVKWISLMRDNLDAIYGVIWGLCVILIGLNLFVIEGEYTLPARVFTSYAILVGAIVVVGMLSYSGQLFSDLVGEISFKIYSTEWYNWSKTFKKNVMIFQEVTKRTRTIQIYGLYPVNLVAFADVLHSAYTLYNFLRLTKK